MDEILPPFAGRRDNVAEQALLRLRSELRDGADAADGTSRALLDRIAQAERKIGSGAPVRRLSELVTLAQYGAGSAGRIVAGACGAPGSAAAFEGLFTARFLIAVIRGSESRPHLIPQDLLDRHGIDRDRMAYPAVRPVHQALLDRARSALHGHAPPARDDTGLFLARQTLLCERQISRLRRRPPTGPGADLRRLDDWLVSARLLLRR